MHPTDPIDLKYWHEDGTLDNQWVIRVWPKAVHVVPTCSALLEKENWSPKNLCDQFKQTGKCDLGHDNHHLRIAIDQKLAADSEGACAKQPADFRISRQVSQGMFIEHVWAWKQIKAPTGMRSKPEEAQP